MEFKIDYGPVAVNPTAARGPLYASVDGRAASLGEGEVVFYDPHLDRNHVMTAQVLEALDACRAFRSMDEHANHLAASLPNMKGQQVAIKRVLEGLASRGLMITDDAFLQRFAQAPARTPADCAGVFVRTCDQPAQFKSLLDSLLPLAKSGKVPGTLWVVDDSTDDAAATEHARLLQAFAEETSLATRYLGGASWLAEVQRLSGLCDDPESVSRLLQRDRKHRGWRGGGIGKNLISLLTAGRRYFLLDDDFQFPLRRHPNIQNEIDFHGQAWSPAVFADVEAAAASGGPVVDDPFAFHLALCGHGLGTLLGARGRIPFNAGSLSGQAPSQTPLMNPSTWVMSTVNGHRGHSGAAALSWLFLLDPRATQTWFASEHYEAIRNNPPVWWGSDRFQVSRRGAFTPFAVDNAQLMPPTSPFGRGEDALFNALAGLMHPDAVQMDVPLSIAHLQQGAPRDRAELLDAPETADVNHCIAEFFRNASDGVMAESPVARLATAAHLLEDLAGSSDANLVSYLREYQVYQRSSLIARMQAVLKANLHAPDAWRADIKRQLEANGRAVIERDPPRYGGWPEDATATDCAALFRREVDVLAAGMRVWPQVWQAAVDTTP